MSGTLSVEDLPRLADSLRPDDGAVQYRLSGVLSAGRPSLHLEVEAVVWLTCQRCMASYPEALVLDCVLPIARNEAELDYWEKLDPLLDALVVDLALDVAALVEDEVLLSLPVVPIHPDGGCSPDSLTLQ